MQTIRVTVTDEAFQALESTTHAEALSNTDVVSRALMFYASVSAAPPGQEVVIKNAADSTLWKRVRVVE